MRMEREIKHAPDLRKVFILLLEFNEVSEPRELFEEYWRSMGDFYHRGRDAYYYDALHSPVSIDIDEWHRGKWTRYHARSNAFSI